MTVDELRSALETYLCPLLAAQVLQGTVPCAASAARTASLEPCKTAVKAAPADIVRLVLYRKPGFSPEELRVTKDFVDELFELHHSTQPTYREELFKFLPSRAIARHLGGSDIVSCILQQFETWSARTYEGGAITSSIGIDPDLAGTGPRLSDIFEHDFSAVLTNGFDTLLVASNDGRISGSGHLASTPLGLNYAPYRLNAVANWTSQSRMALVLNRLGEQLVFLDKRLVFAKRRGEWRYYTHEMYIRQMQPPKNRILREAIYQSALDISFARTGGCIIIVRSGAINDLEDYVANSDRLDSHSPTKKAETLSTLITQPFERLDRRLRQEILALDGATVLDHLGKVIAAGAIVSVPSGSEGGGRTAAAKKGSELGLGIKISEDGGISAYQGGNRVFMA